MTHKLSFTEEIPSGFSSSRQDATLEKERIISTELSSSLDIFPSLSNHLEIKSNTSFEIASKIVSVIDSNESNTHFRL